MTSPRVQAIIVLIGDQAEAQTARAEELRRQGYQVLTAAHGSEADALGQRLGLAHLDLVILDLSRTDDAQVREGYLRMQRWATQNPRLPFILISDDPMPGSLDPPVVWWLANPLTLDILLMAVCDILGS
jgi:CheY-like chemotaxis protein